MGRAVLALDLPIGSHPDGYETWANRTLFAPGMKVGAPPDEFFAEGQNWGFPPQLPGAGRRSGHALWRDLVARAGEHASLLRIDHVMGVQRLWWIPDGCSATDGVYVRYPREELLAVIAAQAVHTSTTIVGENLGTVPEEVTEALERWDVIGMFEEQFNLYHRSALPPVPADSVAGIRTHDMPAFAAAFNGDATGGVYEYRRLVSDAVGHPVGDGAAAVLDAALERLAASAAYLVVADLDDLVGETAPHNVPGKILPSTWRRRLPRADVGRARRPGRPPTARRAQRPQGPRVSANPVGEVDLHLFNEGTHRHLHNCLGAHPDATGTWFAVWAPNAASVDVLGDFDGWSGQQMEPIGRSGIWSRHVAGALVGQSYRYAVTSHHGERMEKSDPIGAATNEPPSTASVISALDHEWNDATWMAATTAATDRSRSTRCTSVRGGASSRRGSGSRPTASSPTRSPITCWRMGSPTSSCCR